MSGNSVNHHWWPVGLQKYWADKNGDVSWIKPDGEIKSKRYKNRKIAVKRQGHSYARNSPWEKNFEDAFKIDDSAPRVISNLQAFKPFGCSFCDFPKLFRIVLSRKKSIKNLCRFYEFEGELYRETLLLVLSLLIRSPAKRNQFHMLSSSLGFPLNDDIGSVNLDQSWQRAIRFSREHSVRNHAIVILHAPKSNFLFGDGFFETITNNLNSLRISGFALVPLTPSICVFLHTFKESSSINPVAAMMASPEIVNEVNSITQIHSKEHLFFLASAPDRSESYLRNDFSGFRHYSPPLIEQLTSIHI